MKGASRRRKGPVLAGSDGLAVELSKCAVSGREQSACGGTGRSSSLPAHRSLCPTRRRRRRWQSCRPFPPDGSLIAAVFFERKSTADTASRPSALLRSKSKSNDFVVVDFEFYLLRPELQPRRALHCVYLADWRARCQQWQSKRVDLNYSPQSTSKSSRLCHSFILVQCGTKRSTIHRNRVNNSI